MTATAQQILGDIGFAFEFDIQPYFRRAKRLQLSWRDTRHLGELGTSAIVDAPPCALLTWSDGAPVSGSTPVCLGISRWLAHAAAERSIGVLSSA
jgi:hypothetical protein